MAAKSLPNKSVPSLLHVFFTIVVFMILIFTLFFLRTRGRYFVYTTNAYTKASRYQRYKGTVVQHTHTQNGWWEINDAPAPCDKTVPLFLSREDSRTFRASCDPTLLLDITLLLRGSLLSLENITSHSTTCPRKLGLNPMRLPSTGLKSWQGSGNTWTRHLIQQLTGIETGSVYRDKWLMNNGFPGESRTTDVIVIKTHKSLTTNFDRQVFVLRNPFDAFAAEYKRLNMKAGHGGQVDITPDDRWLQYVQGGIGMWPYFVHAQLALQQPQLIILYEDMKSCLLRELLRLSNFLRWGKMKYFSVCCTLRESQGPAYRNQGRVPVYELYTGKLLQDMNDMLSTLAKNISLEYPMLAKRLLEYRLI